MECQKSGLTVLGWCRQNRIAPSSYYRHLRKIREGLMEENHIVPIVPPASQSVGEMQITLPETVSAEQFRIILQELKSC